MKGIARKKGVSCSISSYCSFNAHVRAEHHLNHVVGELEGVEEGHRGEERHKCAT